MSSPIVQCPPAALERETAAAYVSLSVTTFERLVQQRQAPQPRQFPARRVAWLRAELDAWLLSLPPSTLLPPANTGAPKPRKGSSE
ncbi:AlpA family phage regulatory protein [Comamonadaceae bacterium PP-2]